MASDFYEALGVPRTADKGEIQQAYRRLARQFHPDINHDPAAEDRFKEISEAYSVLTDDALRAKYDQFGPNFRQVPDDYARRSQGRRSAASPGGSSPGGTRIRFSDDPGMGGVSMDDLFASIFGDREGGMSVPGADQQVQLELTLEEAYHGGRKHIRLPGDPPREYDVTIPRGVVDGQRIRLQGEGGHGFGEGERGDLFLVVKIAPHKRFRLDGRNISTTVSVAPWEAALGATIVIETPGGEVKLKMPEGTSSGRRLRLRGEGLPKPRSGAGDLIAEIQIVVPRKLSRRERGLFEQLADVSDFDPRAAS
jgi:curved DNA-binding protein